MSQPSDSTHRKFLSLPAILTALCVGAIAGGLAGGVWNHFNARYVSVGFIKVDDSVSVATQPSDSEIGPDLMAITSPPFYASVLSGKLYPAPSGAEGMDPTEFASHVRTDQIPDSALIRVQFTANNPKDAMSGVTAILQTFMSTGNPKATAGVASTPPMIPYPILVLAIAKGALLGAAAGLILFIGYRVMNRRSVE